MHFAVTSITGEAADEYYHIGEARKEMVTKENGLWLEKHLRII